MPPAKPWPKCEAEGCVIKVAAGGLCSIHREIEAARGHAFVAPRGHRAQPPYQPCTECGGRRMRHQR